jgi:myosin protein heavy chain
LTATRNDDELRRKNAELQIARVQAERDQQEKEALEKLRSQLELEKRKVEEELEVERGVAVDKDLLLERSKKREAELEQIVSDLQSDLDDLDSQLDRVMKAREATEAKYEAMRDAFNTASEHLTRLEEDEKVWKTKEEELLDDVRKAMESNDVVGKRKEELDKEMSEMKFLVQQREEDLVRAKERHEKAVTDLEGKLSNELKARWEFWRLL